MVEGDTVVVGAEQDDAPAVSSGSAYVFTRTEGVWTEAQKLTGFKNKPELEKALQAVM